MHHPKNCRICGKKATWLVQSIERCGFQIYTLVKSYCCGVYEREILPIQECSISIQREAGISEEEINKLRRSKVKSRRLVP